MIRPATPAFTTASPTDSELTDSPCRHCGVGTKHLSAGQGWVHSDGYKACSREAKIARNRARNVADHSNHPAVQALTQARQLIGVAKRCLLFDGLNEDARRCDDADFYTEAALDAAIAGLDAQEEALNDL